MDNELLLENKLLEYLSTTRDYRTSPYWVSIYNIISDNGQKQFKDDIFLMLTDMSFIQLETIYDSFENKYNNNLIDTIVKILVKRTIKDNKVPKEYFEIIGYLKNIIKELYERNITSGDIFDSIKKYIISNFIGYQSANRSGLFHLSINILAWIFNNHLIVGEKTKKNIIECYVFKGADKAKELIDSNLIRAIDAIFMILGNCYYKSANYSNKLSLNDIIMDIIIKCNVDINNLYKQANMYDPRWVNLINLLDSSIMKQV